MSFEPRATLLVVFQRRTCGHEIVQDELAFVDLRIKSEPPSRCSKVRNGHDCNAPAECSGQIRTTRGASCSSLSDGRVIAAVAAWPFLTFATAAWWLRFDAKIDEGEFILDYLMPAGSSLEDTNNSAEPFCCSASRTS